MRGDVFFSVASYTGVDLTLVSSNCEMVPRVPRDVPLRCSVLWQRCRWPDTTPKAWRKLRATPQSHVQHRKLNLHSPQSHSGEASQCLMTWLKCAQGVNCASESYNADKARVRSVSVHTSPFGLSLAVL